MIKSENTSEYTKVFKVGFDYYGLNGFFEMHKDVCNDPESPWGYALEPLNDLTYEEFSELANDYLSSII